MSSTYSGANTFPSSVTIPDDGDAQNASSVNTPLEGLADRTVWLRDKLGVLDVQTFTSSGSVVVPAGATFAVVRGCGGGGGGGGGLGYQSSLTQTSGGGGGGGAQAGEVICAVAPGDTLTVTIGAGGAGGAAGFNGSPGGSTTLLHGATTLAHFRGAGQGLVGQVSANGLTGYTWGLGGHTVSGNLLKAGDFSGVSFSTLFLWGEPGHGGNGTVGRAAADPSECDGNRSIYGWLGGSHGAGDSSTSGSYQGGGAGGGGGAGPYGAGAKGGDGGTPNNAGASSGGTNGSAAAANTGAGGGGGGSSGNATSGGAGGAGGAGGSGKLEILWLKTGTV